MDYIKIKKLFTNNEIYNNQKKKSVKLNSSINMIIYENNTIQISGDKELADILNNKKYKKILYEDYYFIGLLDFQKRLVILKNEDGLLICNLFYDIDDFYYNNWNFELINNKQTINFVNYIQKNRKKMVK